MTKENFSDIDLILYHQNAPVSVCRPDYIGMLGMHLKVKNLFFPRNCRLEVEIRGGKKTGIDGSRFPVVVASSTDEGLGLKFSHYEPELIDRWHRILSRILFHTNYENYNHATHTV